MYAVGLYRAVRVAWTNPPQRDVAFTQIWASQTNDRATATRVGIPASRRARPQSWLHGKLTPDDTWYYWVRSVDSSGNVSGWLPSSATAGWDATVIAIPSEDLPPGLPTLYAVGFTSVTSVTILGSVHLLASADLVVQLWDAGTPRAAIEAGSMTVHPTTFDVVITFVVAQSGRVVLMG